MKKIMFNDKYSLTQAVLMVGRRRQEESLSVRKHIKKILLDVLGLLNQMMLAPF